MASSVIVKNRKILGGVLVFAGTRSPFQVLPDYIAAGQTLDANRELLRLAQNWFALVSRLLRGLPRQQNPANLKIAVLAVRAETYQMMATLPYVPECWLSGIQSSP